MISQDEARIRLAIDPSQIERGMGTASLQIANLGKTMVGKLNHIIKANLFAAVGDWTDLWDKATKFVAEELFAKRFQAAANRAFQSMQEALHKVSMGVIGDEAKLADLREKRRFDSLSAAEKEAEIQNTILETKRKIAKTNDDIDTNEQARKGVDDPGVRRELILQLGKLRADLVQNEIRLFEKRGQLEEVQKDLSKAALEIERKKTEELQKQNQFFEKQAQDAGSAYARFQGDQDALAAGKRSPLEFSLAELANTRARYTNNWTGQSSEGFTPGARRAQDVLKMQEEAKFAALMGWSNAQQLGDRAQAAMAGLKNDFKFLEDPMERLREEATRSAQALEDMKNKGITIKTMG